MHGQPCMLVDAHDAGVPMKTRHLQFAGCTVLHGYDSLPSYKGAALQQTLPGPLPPGFLYSLPGCGHPHSPPANNSTLLWKLDLPPLPKLPQLRCPGSSGGLHG